MSGKPISAMSCSVRSSVKILSFRLLSFIYTGRTETVFQVE